MKIIELIPVPKEKYGQVIRNDVKTDILEDHTHICTKHDDDLVVLNN